VEQAAEERAGMTNAAPGDALRYGERPLAQTVAAAGAIRRLAGLLLSLEHDHPTVDAMLTQIADWERGLAGAVTPDPTPRIGPDGGETQRVYLDHSSDAGAFNPCFPEYTFDHLGAETASGRVTFPVVYEGPPGLVHGGFLAVFFDSITQHQSCAARLTGKTRSLTVTFRRPTPILTELRFDIVRSQSDGRVTSTARLLLDDEVLCIGEFNTVASSPDRLTGVQFGKRRVT
jgi:acyl-coenzyme A thioesterase PaaI-like protein